MQTWELKANQELRFFAGDEKVKLELRRGLAEVCGTEMLANKTYTFPRGSNIAVFTFHGATIEMTGSPSKSHVGTKCDYMNFYLDIHADLEHHRELAELYSQQTSENALDIKQSPICLVCKPDYSNTRVGKTTLSKILVNYAERRGRTPIFVNLDPEKGPFGVPGTIGAVSIEEQIDIENGLSLKSSMLLHFGHTTPEVDNSTLLYRTLVENLAQIVHSKLEQDKKSFHSGVIVNACAWNNDKNNELLLHACKAFNANFICVMDDEVLEDDLRKALVVTRPDIKVVNAPKTVSIVAHSADSQVEMKYKRIKEYFYGTHLEPYSPFTSEIKFSFLRRFIYTIGNPLKLPDSLMPLGAETQTEQLKVIPYDCKASDLLHHVLAISYKTIDEVVDDPTVVLCCNIMGFMCVTDVRRDEDLVTILAPQKLPNPMDKVLLISSTNYVDSLLE